MMSAPHDPTELAASVQAWGLAEDYPDEPLRGRFNPGRIVAAAVAASLLVVTVAGAVAWTHLRPEMIPVAETSTMVQATVAPTITATAKPLPPPPPPAPPPVTVTTVVIQAPAPTAAPIGDDGIYTPEAIANWDQQFITKMIGHGYPFDTPLEAAKVAHQVCAMFERGQRATAINDWVETTSGRGRSFAVIFVSTAMLTYPNCP